MIKSKIVTIGEDLCSNLPKIMRIYEKITNIKIEETFKCSSGSLMDSRTINNENEEELHKYYKNFESAILNDEHLNILCFDNIEDFQKFDINGVLKEKSIIIDKIAEEDYGMTSWELSTYCNKACKVQNKGDHKVVLVDTLTGKEYMVSEFEPRRTFIKETDKTIEFSIYPVKTEQVKEIEKITVSEFVKSKLDENNKNPNWLAKEINISTSSTYGKLDRDSFNAYDLIKIAKLFNLDFEELMKKVKLTE